MSNRSSNIELLRIVALVMIIMHHAALHGGVMTFEGSGPLLIGLGLWGKAAINAFVLITGYFMCESSLTLKRYWKVLGPALLYTALAGMAMVIVGFEPLTVKTVVHAVFWPMTDANNGFVGSFIWFYLLIPILNIIVNSGLRSLHLAAGFFLVLYMVLPSLFFNKYLGSEIGWFATIYLVGAVIRQDAKAWMSSNRICLPILLGSMALSYLSVIGLHVFYGKCEYFFTGMNKPFGFLVGVFAFLVFKNLKLGYSKVINLLASCAWAVLLLHAANDGMRQFLWHDFFDVPSLLTMPAWKSGILLIGMALTVYAVGSAVDLCLKKIWSKVCHERR